MSSTEDASPQLQGMYLVRACFYILGGALVMGVLLSKDIGNTIQAIVNKYEKKLETMDEVDTTVRQQQSDELNRQTKKWNDFCKTLDSGSPQLTAKQIRNKKKAGKKKSKRNKGLKPPPAEPSGNLSNLSFSGVVPSSSTNNLAPLPETSAGLKHPTQTQTVASSATATLETVPEKMNIAKQGLLDQAIPVTTTDTIREKMANYTSDRVSPKSNVNRGSAPKLSGAQYLSLKKGANETKGQLEESSVAASIGDETNLSDASFLSTSNAPTKHEFPNVPREVEIPAGLFPLVSFKEEYPMPCEFRKNAKASSIRAPSSTFQYPTLNPSSNFEFANL